MTLYMNIYMHPCAHHKVTKYHSINTWACTLTQPPSANHAWVYTDAFTIVLTQTFCHTAICHNNGVETICFTKEHVWQESTTIVGNLRRQKMSQLSIVYTYLLC
jgi:hypothetical protein